VKREDIGLAAVAYMAEMMDLHESDRDQEQNQLARHLAQFGARCFTAGRAEGLKVGEQLAETGMSLNRDQKDDVEWGYFRACKVIRDAIQRERTGEGK